MGGVTQRDMRKLSQYKKTIVRNCSTVDPLLRDRPLVSGNGVNREVVFHQEDNILRS